MMIPRRISNTHGTWDVVHPFSGKVEFWHTDKELAEAVAAEFDRRSPVDIGWLYDAIIMHRSEHGDGPAGWAMSSDTLRWLRMLRDPAGQYIFESGLAVSAPDHLFGMPVDIDESAEGVSVRHAVTRSS